MNREDWKNLIEKMFPDKKHKKEVAKHLRVAASGQSFGPDLYSMFEVLGEETVRVRILQYLQRHQILDENFACLV